MTDEIDMNRLWNVKNPNQGAFRKVLCVCSAGLLRSPTAALILSKSPFNFNTRAAGLESYALIPVDNILLEWADEVVCMSLQQVEQLQDRGYKGKILNLDVPDNYEYRNPSLITIMKKKLTTIYKSDKKVTK